MNRLPRFVSSLASVGLVVTACGSDEVAQRPTITATPTTSVVPVTEPAATEPSIVEPTVPVTEPDVTEPDVTEPGVTEPTDIEPTDPVTTEPTDPVTTEPTVTEPPATAPIDPFVELARIQLVADGYSEADAECLASNLDFTDPLVLELDPEAIAPAFETCGVVPLPPS